MKHEGSLPCSQEPVTCSCAEPVKSRSHSPTYAWVSQTISLPSFWLPQQSPVCIPFLPCPPHPPLFDDIHPYTHNFPSVCAKLKYWLLIQHIHSFWNSRQFKQVFAYSVQMFTVGEQVPPAFPIHSCIRFQPWCICWWEVETHILKAHTCWCFVLETISFLIFMRGIEVCNQKLEISS